MVVQIKGSEDVAIKKMAALTYEQFIKLYKTVYDNKRHWDNVCVANPGHNVSIARMGWVYYDAQSGEETDNSADGGFAICDTCDEEDACADANLIRSFLATKEI